MKKTIYPVLLSGLLLLVLFQSCTIEEDQWSGTLTISAESDLDGSDPGAEIILDGRATSLHTPALITDLEVGQHDVTLLSTLFRMEEGTGTFHISSDQPHQELTILMLRNRGGVEINPQDAAGNPVDARVIVDLNSNYPPAPCSLAVPTGQHLLHLAADAFTVTPESLRVDVQHDQAQTLDFTLTPVVGDSYEVEVIASDEEGNPAEGVEIWLDGLPYGYSTPAQFTVAPNDVDHLLELRIGDNVRAERMIQADQVDPVLWEPVVSEIELAVLSTPTGMPIYIDERTTGFDTPHTFPLTGTHFISVAAPGYTTQLPGGMELDVTGDTQVELTLTPGNGGVQVGDVATDLLLPLYESDPVENWSVHQFRGRVTLLNFWFYN